MIVWGVVLDAFICVGALIDPGTLSRIYGALERNILHVVVRYFCRRVVCGTCVMMGKDDYYYCILMIPLLS